MLTDWEIEVDDAPTMVSNVHSRLLPDLHSTEATQRALLQRQSYL